jgi:DNA invertase Pin-like site-specific DNA recombinase
VADDAKSVTRQIERATAYARRKGWTVDPAYIYADDAMSGAEFAKRPGFLRLMTALKPRPPFEVLVVMDEDRLGREQIETAWVRPRAWCPSTIHAILTRSLYRGEVVWLSTPPLTG